MYQQSFKTANLKTALETALEFRIKSLDRIGGGGAINFKAVREADGFCFVVKCFPPERHAACERLAATLKIMDGVKTPTVVFADTIPAVFESHRLLCLAWQEGEVLDIDKLTDAQWIAFLDDYQKLSNRMQLVVTNDEIPSIRDMWNTIRAACHGLRGWFIRKILDGMNLEELDYRPDLVRIVHGDFHKGNILFANGEVKCFMDFESLRKGYAIEDICVLLTIAARKLKRSEKDRLCRILQLFSMAIKRLPNSVKEWRLAINALRMKRVFKKLNGFEHNGLMSVVEMISQVRVYDLFAKQIDYYEA